MKDLEILKRADEAIAARDLDGLVEALGLAAQALGVRSGQADGMRRLLRGVERERDYLRAVLCEPPEVEVASADTCDLRHGLFRNFAWCCADALKDLPSANFVQFMLRDKADLSQRYVVTIQRGSGLTPAERCGVLTTALDDLLCVLEQGRLGDLEAALWAAQRALDPVRGHDGAVRHPMPAYDPVEWSADFNLCRGDDEC